MRSGFFESPNSGNSGQFFEYRKAQLPMAVAILGLVLPLGLPADELAAPADAGVTEEVIVQEARPDNPEMQPANATKTPTPLIDIPQSISVVTRAQIDDQQFTSLAELLQFMPGVAVSQGEAHRDAISIRGNKTTADFFIDGLRDDVQYFRPLYNIERVEVLRGANALLFGRGGTGGAINRVLKKPQHQEEFAEVSGLVDTFGALNFAFDGNTEINERVAVRFNSFYERFDNHRDFFEGERFGLNPTVDIVLGNSTHLFASYEFLNDWRVVDRGVPSVGSAPGRGPLKGYDNMFFGSPDANKANLVAHILQTKLEHQINAAWTSNLMVQYAYYDKVYQNLYPVEFDPVANEVTLDGYRDPTERENIIVQGNLVGEFDLFSVGHTVLAGAEYVNSDTRNSRLDTLFPSSADDQVTIDFSNPLNIPGFGFVTPARDRKVNVDTTSFYLQDQVDVLEWLQLVGGFRVDRFDLDVDDIQNAQSISQVDTEISKRFGVILKPFEDFSFYGSYSESFLPPSGDQALSTNLAESQLNPQRTENIETGVKWDVLPGLALTAAIFRLELESVTEVNPVDPEDTITLGGTVIKGAEAQLVGSLTDNWTIMSGVSYMDGEIEDPGSADDGNTTRETPKYMASLWSRYNVSDQLGFGVGVTHQSEYFAAADNQVVVPSFTRLDGGIFYTVNPNLELQVNIENITNTDYFPNSHSNSNISTGEPINARFSVRARF